MIKRCIILLILTTAPLTAEPKFTDNSTALHDITDDILKTLIPDSIQNLPLPDVPGEVRLKGLKELHWNSDHTTLNFHTQLNNPNSVGMNYTTDHTHSTLRLDSSGEYQFQWQFKKTFGGPK